MTTHSIRESTLREYARSSVPFMRTAEEWMRCMALVMTPAVAANPQCRSHLAIRATLELIDEMRPQLVAWITPQADATEPSSATEEEPCQNRNRPTR